MSDTALPRLDWRVVFNRATPPGMLGWGRVRAAQVKEMSRPMVIAASGQAISAILLVLILNQAVPGWMLCTWVVAVALLMLAAARNHRKLQLKDIHSLSRHAVERVGYWSVSFALVWAVPSRIFFNYADHAQQLAICVVTAGMMAGAAFVFTTVPAAGAAYVAIVGISATNMLSSSGSAAIAALGPLYMAGLFLVVLSNGRAFMQRKCVELALEERSETISLLLREYESSDADWLWQTNSKLTFRNVSPRFGRALGLTIEQLEGLSILSLVKAARQDGRGSPGALEAAAKSLAKRRPLNDVVLAIDTPNGTRCIELSARPRYSRHGRFLGYSGVGSDVTDARLAADRIAHMARHDALTGLPNRIQVLEALGRDLERASGADSPCAVLLIDLDRFKAVNDSHGHPAGDALLKQVCSRFRPHLGPEMMAGRLGGDEFAVVVASVPDKRELQALARGLIDSLSMPFPYHGQSLFVGASIGIALGPRHGSSVEELIHNADLALYRAKASGGNAHCFYEPSLHATAEERRRIEVAMRTALERGELSVVYQPIIDARSHQIVGLEALARWQNAEVGEVPPSRFMPIAEETGLVTGMGEWVLRTACEEAARWPAHVCLNVNISPRQLQEPGFLRLLVSALSASSLAPHRLELEITETVFLNVAPPTRKVLRQIQELGVKLAMDDFGTGYSSLGYLREASFDSLKIDKSFVQGASRDNPESGAIIRAVVALAESLGMTTVAEGVETKEQLDLVRELGCDRVQGFIFAGPRSAAALAPMLLAADSSASRAVA